MNLSFQSLGALIQGIDSVYSRRQNRSVIERQIAFLVFVDVHFDIGGLSAIRGVGVNPLTDAGVGVVVGIAELVLKYDL